MSSLYQECSGPGAVPYKREQASGDGQAEAGSAELHRRLVARLRELVEDAVDDLRRDADPVSVTANDKRHGVGAEFLRAQPSRVTDPRW